jgi:hypothetical protein
MSSPDPKHRDFFNTQGDFTSNPALFWILLLFFLPWPANVAALQAMRPSNLAHSRTVELSRRTSPARR